MKLIDAKLIRGSIAATRMEWLCSELESMPFPPGSEKGPEYIACIDYTVPSHAASIFFVNKDQPPETFDWHPDAVRPSYEQLAMAQLTVMEWDKLKDGDEISLDDEMEEKIREWGGHIWLGGSITEVEKGEPGVLSLKKQSVEERDIGHYIYYKVKNEQY